MSDCGSLVLTYQGHQRGRFRRRYEPAKISPGVMNSNTYCIHCLYKQKATVATMCVPPKSGAAENHQLQVLDLEIVLHANLPEFLAQLTCQCLPFAWTCKVCNRFTCGSFSLQHIRNLARKLQYNRSHLVNAKPSLLN